jgi:hypothetical protein
MRRPATCLTEIALCGPALMMFGAWSVFALVGFTVGIFERPSDAVKLKNILWGFIIFAFLPLSGIIGLGKAIISRGAVVRPIPILCGVIVAAPFAFGFTWVLPYELVVSRPMLFMKYAVPVASLWSCVLVALFHLRDKARMAASVQQKGIDRA